MLLFVRDEQREKMRSAEQLLMLAQAEKIRLLSEQAITTFTLYT